MASTPSFANIPRIGIGAVSVANPNRDGTGTLVDILTGVAAGTRIDRIVIKASENLADSIINLFLYNGTTNYIFDAFDIGDPAVGSTIVDTYREERRYDDLVLPTSIWVLRASITVAPTTGVANVFAFGADLT